MDIDFFMNAMCIFMVSTIFIAKTSANMTNWCCRLYSERAVSLDLRLKELEGGTEPEYLKSLAELDKNKEMRIQVAGVVP